MSSDYVINKDGSRQHRKVVERYLGRELKVGEIVHHLDEDKENNAITNLALFESNADHIKFHKKYRRTLMGLRGYNRNKDKERFMRILYATYGITFYGPLCKTEINKNALKMAEQMKKDLGLRESEVLYSCH